MPKTRLPGYPLTCRAGHVFVTYAKGGNTVRCPECRRGGQSVTVHVPVARPTTATDARASLAVAAVRLPDTTTDLCTGLYRPAQRGPVDDDACSCGAALMPSARRTHGVCADGCTGFARLAATLHDDDQDDDEVYDAEVIEDDDDQDDDDDQLDLVDQLAPLAAYAVRLATARRAAPVAALPAPPPQVLWTHGKHCQAHLVGDAFRSTAECLREPERLVIGMARGPFHTHGRDRIDLCNDHCYRLESYLRAIEHPYSWNSFPR